jgi:Domain of unknown function (DUF1707)
MTEPGNRAAADRGRMRAGHADRERAVGVLKAAYVQGRLDQDELGARVGRAYASQTYGELAALTADIPADGPAPAGPAAVRPVRSPARTLGIATRRAAILMLAAIATAEGAFLLPASQEQNLGIMFFAAVILAMAALGFFGYGIVDAVEARRSLRQTPPPAGPGGAGLESRRPVRKPAPPGSREDPTRADLRARRTGRARPVYGTAAAG